MSEIVSNAYCHTDSPQVRVEVTVNHRQVTVYVTDDEPGRLPTPPPPRTPGADTGADEGGRGLLLVDALAARWGTTAYGARSPHSKTVWFTLSAASAAHLSIDLDDRPGLSSKSTADSRTYTYRRV